MDLETALLIIEGCAIGSLTPDRRSCDAMEVINREVERLRSCPDPIAALERWNSQEKCRSVSIHIDSGYGATCWTVELRRGMQSVYCSETNFLAYDGVDPLWHEKDGNLHCCVKDGDEMEDWPGLASTIMHAIACAEKFWGG